MDYGMPTLIENDSLEECAKLCKQLSLNFIELSTEMPPYKIENLNVSELKAISEHYSVYYTIHFEDHFNPCDFNSKVAQAYTDTALRAFEISEKLSVPLLNMHFPNGTYFTLPEKKVYLYDRYKNEFTDKLRAFRDVCTAAVGNSDIKISVENTSAFQLDFVAEGIDILLESPVFALTFDTGHDAGHNFKHFPLIERHINRLRHMHLHDYSKEKGDHLPVGSGELDIEKYLALAKEHNCRVLLETKTAQAVEQAANWLKERGFF